MEKEVFSYSGGSARLDGEFAFPTREQVEKILADPMLKKAEYSISGHRVFVCNASKRLLSPREEHQMFAKGLVVEDTGRVLAVPPKKFYNWFEAPVEKDLKSLDYSEKVLLRKYDGVLVSRWQLEGKVFFSTRGRLVVPGNPYWGTLLEAIHEDPRILDFFPAAEYRTDFFELVGPGARVIEKYPRNQLVYLGTFGALGKSFSFEEIPWGFSRTETYSGVPQEVIRSWEGVREGLVVNYLDREGRVVYRVKHKQDEYLSLHRSLLRVSVPRLQEMILEKSLFTWEDVEAEVSELPEEVVHWYKSAFPEALAGVAPVLERAAEIERKLSETSVPENPKERYLLFSVLFGREEAGIALAYHLGKLDRKGMVKKLWKNSSSSRMSTEKKNS